MPTPSTGPIGFNDLNIELGVPATTTRTINDTAVRTLAGAPFATPGTTISLNDLRGKSNSVSATGGTVIVSGGFRIHVFTSPGSFVVSNAGPGTVEYLVVAGGGGGGAFIGAGGGAGGYRTGSGFPVIATTYPITIGGGGASAITPTTPYQGGNGSASIFSTITSTGGGGGGGGAYSADNPSKLGRPGGSGGGCTPPNQPEAGTGNTPPTSPPQGNPGGNAGGIFGNTGGGGGAAAAGDYAGFSNPPIKSGNGGIGSPITWLPASYGTPGPAPGRYFAGGGGGGSESYPLGFGGSGGGGNGGQGRTGTGSVPIIDATPGTTNTGGGGGGGNNLINMTPPGVGTSGSGGSGIVAIRYPI